MTEVHSDITETTLSPEDCIRYALSASKNAKACFTNSFQAEDMVVLDFLRQQIPDITVVFLDTGYHFSETYAYRDRMVSEWNLNILNVSAGSSVREHESKLGKLYFVDPTQCCNLRKVQPLFEALESFDLWFTGLRREQSPTRRNMKQMEKHRLVSGKEIDKISPLAAWPWSEVELYAEQHNIPLLPLYAQGYTSIGCEPCTVLSTDPSNPRSGRWGGKKLECGIHTFVPAQVEPNQ